MNRAEVLARRADRCARARAFKVGERVRVVDEISGCGEITGNRDLEPGDLATVDCSSTEDYANDAGYVTVKSDDGDYYSADVDAIERVGASA